MKLINKKSKINSCVMCGKGKEQRIIPDKNQIVLIHYIDPSTKEQLCAKCNDENNRIYFEKGIKKEGKLKIEVIGKIQEDESEGIRE